MPQITPIIAVVLLLASLTGCSSLAKSASTKEAAEAVAKTYFDAVKRKDYDTVLTLYDQSFLDKTSPELWKSNLGKINEKLGDLQSYEQQGWQAKDFIGTEKSGIYQTLEYSVTYARAPAKETLTLFMPNGATTFKILGHHISSQGLLD